MYNVFIFRSALLSTRSTTNGKVFFLSFVQLSVFLVAIIIIGLTFVLLLDYLYLLLLPASRSAHSM